MFTRYSLRRALIGSVVLGLAILSTHLFAPSANAATFDFFATTSPGIPSNPNTNPNTLVRVNPDDGTQTQAGPLGGTPNSRHIDWDPISNTILGVDRFGDAGLIQRIDPATGIASPLLTVQQGGVPVGITSISFASDGTLYGVSGGNFIANDDMLGTIDLSNGNFTPLRSLVTSDTESINSIDIAPDGTLYAIRRDFDPAQNTRELIKINLPSLNTLDELLLMSTLAIDDIDFAPDGFLYHTNFSFALFRMDPTTGAQTNMGFGDIGAISGLTSVVPIPSALILFASAVLGLLGVTTRKHYRSGLQTRP